MAKKSSIGSIFSSLCLLISDKVNFCFFSFFIEISLPDSILPIYFLYEFSLYQKSKFYPWFQILPPINEMGL